MGCQDSCFIERLIAFDKKSKEIEISLYNELYR